jgi:hypothetical protein
VFGVAALLLCGYFAYASFTDIREGDFYWQNGWWIALTWAVWLVFTAGLLSETRCWRERVLFGCALAAFTIGLVFSVWLSAQPAAARAAREASLGLWSLAALAGLSTLQRPTQLQN